MHRAPAGGFRRVEFAVALSVVFFCGGMAAAAALSGGDEIMAHLGKLDGPLVAALLGLSLLNYASRTLRWHLYSHHLGMAVPLGRSALFYVAGFALTTTPGKVGEALRLWLMERSDGYRYERTMPLLVADRVSDMGAMGVLLLFGLAGAAAHPLLLLVAVGGVSVMLVLAARPQAAPRLVGAGYGLVGRWPRLFGRLRGAARRTTALFTPRLFLLTLLLAVVGWLAECAAFALVLRAFGADIGLQAATLVFTAGMLVGAMTLVPGGIGGTEATMLALLAVYGVGLDTAIPATVVIRVTTLWFAVALGFAFMPPALRLARRAVP
ncbi:MAG TPA: lysylphosphatidylglycerol synthase transmembrane domain-containing protein [Alphaproteobacteria bacterium]|nr:lysylphosphatidylglycerol synthase transmembrane domain-containing protein [Alphaproteobacteria bacterium]